MYRGKFWLTYCGGEQAHVISQIPIGMSGHLVDFMPYTELETKHQCARSLCQTCFLSDYRFQKTHLIKMESVYEGLKTAVFTWSHFLFIHSLNFKKQKTLIQSAQLKNQKLNRSSQFLHFFLLTSFSFREVRFSLIFKEMTLYACDWFTF